MDLAQDEIRQHFSLSEKGPKTIVAWTALFFAIATSNELWLTSADSIFARLTPEFCIMAVTIIMALLSLANGRKLRDEGVDKGHPASAMYGISCALGDILIMTGMAVLVYLMTGEVGLLDPHEYWKVFYVGATTAAGEFGVSSTISKLLQRAKTLQREIDQVDERLERLCAEAQALSVPDIPPSVTDSEIMDAYLDSKQSGGHESGRREGTERD